MNDNPVNVSMPPNTPADSWPTDLQMPSDSNPFPEEPRNRPLAYPHRSTSGTFWKPPKSR